MLAWWGWSTSSTSAGHYWISSLSGHLLRTRPANSGQLPMGVCELRTPESADLGREHCASETQTRPTSSRRSKSVPKPSAGRSVIGAAYPPRAPHRPQRSPVKAPVRVVESRGDAAVRLPDLLGQAGELL